jgi:hypothetical protein
MLVARRLAPQKIARKVPPEEYSAGPSSMPSPKIMSPLLSRDFSSRAVAKVYGGTAGDVHLSADGREDQSELFETVDGPPQFSPQARWLMFADIALTQAREEQQRIKAKIRPHVERYKRITGNKK